MARVENKTLNRHSGKAIGKVFMQYLLITVGCIIYAVGFCWFFKTNSITVGGFTGISQILNRLIPAYPIGIGTIIMNLPLFVLCVRKQGLKMLFPSVYAIFVSSLLIDGMKYIYTFKPCDDPLLAAICGGVIFGSSMGMLLNYGATTGGTQLVARLLKYKFRFLSVGKLSLAIDIVVIVLYTLTFRNIYNALYGIIAMYISSVAMDAVIYGIHKSRMAYVVSDHCDEICDFLLKMKLGVTIVDAKGGWTGQDKKMILCVFKNHEVGLIKSSITSIDPDAFIILCEANEVLGIGFEKYSDDNL